MKHRSHRGHHLRHALVRHRRGRRRARAALELYKPLLPSGSENNETEVYPMTTTTPVQTAQPNITEPTLAGIDPHEQMTGMLLVLGLEMDGIKVEAWAPPAVARSEWRGALAIRSDYNPKSRQDAEAWAADPRTANLLAIGRVALGVRREHSSNPFWPRDLAEGLRAQGHGA